MMNHHPQRSRYRHAEAFCRMTYRCAEGHEEVLYNSRDGVTPFAVTIRPCGHEGRHVFALARRDPQYVPPPGSRVFVDMTQVRAAEHGRVNAARWWNDPFTATQARLIFSSQEEMARRLAEDYFRPGVPDLVTVSDA